MAQLFTLMFGRSKKRMKPIMTDTKHKVDNYRKAREATKNSDAGSGWHDVVPAALGSVPWRKSSATVGGYKDQRVARVGEGKHGWIGKGGFQEHT